MVARVLQLHVASKQMRRGFLKSKSVSPRFLPVAMVAELIVLSSISAGQNDEGGPINRCRFHIEAIYSQSGAPTESQKGTARPESVPNTSAAREVSTVSVQPLYGLQPTFLPLPAIGKSMVNEWFLPEGEAPGRLIREILEAVGKERLRVGEPSRNAADASYADFTARRLSEVLEWAHHRSGDPLAGEGIKVAELPLRDSPREWLRLSLRRHPNGKVLLALHYPERPSRFFETELTHSVFNSSPLGQPREFARLVQGDVTLEALGQFVELMARERGAENPQALAAEFVRKRKAALLVTAEDYLRASPQHFDLQPVAWFRHDFICTDKLKMSLAGAIEFSFKIDSQGDISLLSAQLVPDSRLKFEIAPLSDVVAPSQQEADALTAIINKSFTVP
jgi:hypothetical protein